MTAMPLIPEIVAATEALTAIRRDFHAHPETAFEEVRTAARVAQLLEQWGIEVHRGLARTGLVGILRGTVGASTRAIGLRADMDALPMTEHNRFAHASTVPGKMHACGHDGHTTMLLGAAQYLARHRDFDGTVYFIFQPAEENGNAGARAMIEDGLFERFPCDEIYGLHNMPGLPAGQLGFRAGPIMASGNRFDITLRGTGGHAAIPDRAIDPVVVAGSLIGALQTLVSRNTSPLDSAVLSVTQVHAGETYNVIPDEAILGGTVRTFRTDTLDRIESGLRRMVETLPQAYGAQGRLDFKRGYPPVVNHPAQTAFAADTAIETFGASQVDRDTPALGAAEDFAFYLQHVPGSYLFLGNGDGTHRASQAAEGPCQLHNGSYDFNDALLPIGATYWVRLAEAFFRHHPAHR